MRYSQKLTIILITLFLFVNCVARDLDKSGSSVTAISLSEDGSNIDIAGVHRNSAKFSYQGIDRLGSFWQVLSKSGELIDADSRVDTASDIYVSDLSIDSMGSNYFTGSLTGRIGAIDRLSHPDARTLGTDCYIESTDSEGSYRWGRVFGGNGNDVCLGIACLPPGSIFVVGAFESPFSIELEDGSVQEIENHGSDDLFACRLDGNGNLEWIKNWGGSGADVAFSIAAANNGFLYLVGYFEDSITLDTIAGDTTKTSMGDRDCFLCKISDDAHIEWLETWGGPERDMAMDVAVDNDGAIYVTGGFGSSVEMNPGPDESLMISNGDKDGFLAKFDENGNCLAFFTWGSSSADESFAVAVSESSIAVTGWFRDSMTLQSAEGENNVIADGESDIFLLNFDRDLNLQWARTWGVGGTFEDIGRDLVIDEDETIYVVGTESGEMHVASFFANGSRSF